MENNLNKEVLDNLDLNNARILRIKMDSCPAYIIQCELLLTDKEGQKILSILKKYETVEFTDNDEDDKKEDKKILSIHEQLLLEN